jgi:acyl-CoA thioester hydrolase
MLTQHEITIRVRYQETDAQARVHHANYITYFEMGRVELLRAAGYSYKSLEEQGILLVVAEVTCQYFLPAAYDDLLRLVTTTLKAKGARIEHGYELYRDDQLIARGRSIVGCIDSTGRVRRLPDWLQAVHEAA